MKRQVTVLALGALVALAMATPSFAASNHTTARGAVARHATNPYSGYYDSSVPEGNYTYAPTYSTGGPSGDMGGIGR